MRFYSPVAYKMATMITGGNTQDIQRRFCEVNLDLHETHRKVNLSKAISAVDALYGGDWGEMWEDMLKNEDDEDWLPVLNTIHYIVGDSW